MVRKTTAVEVNKNVTKNTAKSTTSEETGINFEKLLQDAREGAKENSHLLIGVVALLRGLIILREFLVGMILVTTGILLISGFFKK